MSTSNQTRSKSVFCFMAPEAQTVQLAGDFTGWELSPVSLKKQKTGLWKTMVALDSGRHEYRFLVDGQWRDDPACTARVPNPFGAENCVRQID